MSTRYPSLEIDGTVALLDLGDNENRFNLDSMRLIESLLDRVCAEPAARALVTRAHGRFFSNGLDLGWMAERPGRRERALRALQHLLARMLELPVPTVAAVQGHAFAGGAMFALTHDVTVMRADRGYWCLPEVSLGLSFTTGMTALLAARLPRRIAHTAMTSARRYSGAEALTAGIVDATATSDQEVLAAALITARDLAPTAHPALGTVRGRLYAEARDALRSDAFRPDTSRSDPFRPRESR